jgi:tetratricopeptide (TPR) repeat protein
MNWWPNRQKRKSLLNAVHFDTTRWLLEKKRHNSLEWSNGYGDTLRASVDQEVPEERARLVSRNSLREYYRKEASRINGGIVLTDFVQAGGISVVMVIRKYTAGSGYRYEGSLVVPFKGGEYTISIHSQERDITGEREALVTAYLAQAGELKLEHPTASQENRKVLGWFGDPYDPDYDGITTNVMSDDDRLDYFLPDHPLSKVRKYLKEIQSTLSIDPTALEDAVVPSREQGIPEREEPVSQPRRLLSSAMVALIYRQHSASLLGAGRFDDAVRTLEFAIGQLERSGGNDELVRAKLLFLVGAAYNCLQKYSDAEPKLSRARDIFEQALGPEDLQTSATTMNLALVYLSQDRHDAAEPLLLQTLKVFRAKDAHGSNAAIAINGIGLVHQKRGQHSEAISNFKEALEIFEKVHGPDYIECQTVLTNLAISLRKTGDEKRAEETLERARRVHLS